MWEHEPRFRGKGRKLEQEKTASTIRPTETSHPREAWATGSDLFVCGANPTTFYNLETACTEELEWQGWADLDRVSTPRNEEGLNNYTHLTRLTLVDRGDTVRKKCRLPVYFIAVLHQEAVLVARLRDAP